MAWTFTSRAPVYLQIVSRVRADILNGVYKADQQIPAVRQLAFEAGVNPNTMQRAFAVLEAERLFVTRGTVGRFITGDAEVLARARETMLRETVEQILADAAAVGLTPRELVERINAAAPSPSPAEGDPAPEAESRKE